MLTNEELCVLAQSGDEEAGNQLFIQNKKFLHQVCYKFSNLAEHEELFSIVQVGFVKAMNKYQPGKGYKFLTYAGRTLENEILCSFRSGNRKLQFTSMEEVVIKNSNDDELLLIDILKSDDSTEDSVVETENHDELTRYLAVACKSDLHREVMKLHLQGKKQIEIAEIIGHTRSYVSRIIQDVTKRMREQVKKENKVLV